MNQVLEKSKYLQIVASDKYPFFVVYHSLFGFPQIMNQDGLDLLNAFSGRSPVSDVVGKSIFEGALAHTQELEKNFFLLHQILTKGTF